MRQAFARPLVLVVMFAWATSVAADATVTFDFTTNIGFVDRSATQTAFGLNNGQMQKRADQVVFTAVQRSVIAVNCVGGAPREAVTETIATVDFTLVPTKGSFDGFALAGVRDIVVSDPPSATVICGGPGSFGAQIRVDRVLSASLGGQSAVLIEEH